MAERTCHLVAVESSGTACGCTGIMLSWQSVQYTALSDSQLMVLLLLLEVILLAATEEFALLAASAEHASPACCDCCLVAHNNTLQATSTDWS